REEPDLPSTRPGDPDTLRILSIHKAKGLEAPVVALFDTADEARNMQDVIALWEEGRVAIGFRKGFQPPGWDVLKKRDDARAWAELRRLLYVACTRARDLLVIPCPPSDARVGGFWRDLVDAVRTAPADEVVAVDAETLPAPTPERVRLDLARLRQAEGTDAAAAQWERRRAQLVETAAARPLVPASVTAVAGRSAPPAVLA